MIRVSIAVFFLHAVWVIIQLHLNASSFYNPQNTNRQETEDENHFFLFISLDQTYKLSFYHLTSTTSYPWKAVWKYIGFFRRSNGNFNILPHPSQGIWLSSVPGEWGIWPLPAWGGENWTGSVRFQMIFFFRAPKSVTATKQAFGRDGRVQRKRCSICERLAHKKGHQKVFIKTAGADDDCSLVGYERQIRR